LREGTSSSEGTGELTSACVLWAKRRDKKGYGKTRHQGRTMLAHRVAWEKAHGPIPGGLCVCHKCDNPPCTNVEHLFLGSYDDNNQDRGRKGRTAKGSRTGQARLTEETATFAMARLLVGETQSAVAAAFGVSQPAISDLWTGLTWGHAFEEAL
jgi:hypothetical protein